MRFSPRAGDATIFKKIASPSQGKNRSCSRGLNLNQTSRVTCAQACQALKLMFVPSTDQYSSPLTQLFSLFGREYLIKIFG